MTLVPTRTKPNPALDEVSFQELLAAAYVVQQHNDALNRLGPALAQETVGNFDVPVKKELQPVLAESPVSGLPDPAEPESLPSRCRVCGRPFGADEVFCGSCSMPRVAAPSSENLQSKWASLLYMQRAQLTKHEKPQRSENRSEQTQVDGPQQARDALPSNEASLEAAPRLWPVQHSVSGSLWNRGDGASEQETGAGISDSGGPLASRETDSSKPPVSNHTPQAAPDLLQRTWQGAWERLRGRYLAWIVSATGLLLFFLVLSIWPSRTRPQLTWFQNLLVELGIADLPARPVVARGNPDAKVWVDVHTGLYYCGGSDLFGKTPGGYVATQYDAQEDQFEAAERTPCP